MFSSFKMEENIDYSRWQRQSAMSPRCDGRYGASQTKKKPQKKEFRPSLPPDRKAIQSRNSQISKLSKDYSITKSLTKTSFKSERESACSSLCRHWPNSTRPDERRFEEKTTATSPGAIQLLKFQIKAKRNCIIECRKLIINLVEDNFKLRQKIENSDKGAYTGAKEQLQRYSKYRNAMETMNKEHGKQRIESQIAFDKVKKSTEEMTAKLEKKLWDIQNAVEQKYTELKTLNTYKDKEYPEKINRIGRLKSVLEYLGEEQSVDISETEEIIKVENEKYKTKALQREADVLEGISNDVFNSMDGKVKQTGLQNIQLKREIEIHKREVGRLHKENQILEDKICKAINEDRPEIQRKLYPGVFVLNEICTPETEIALDIPRKDFIPL